MFYGNHCGHCKEMKPQWDIAKKEINSEMMGMGYKLYDIDTADANNKKLVDEYKVAGVPYIVKVNVDGKSVVYTGPRKFKDITKWIQAK